MFATTRFVIHRETNVSFGVARKPNAARQSQRSIDGLANPFGTNRIGEVRSIVAETITSLSTRSELSQRRLNVHIYIYIRSCLRNAVGKFRMDIVCYVRSEVQGRITANQKAAS